MSTENQQRPDTSREFAGEVFVVTGAAQGLGREIAVEAARRGADVAVCDLDGDKARAVATELGSAHGVRALAQQCDVSAPAEVAALAERVVAEFGRIDHWINNAGTLHIGPIVDTEPQAFRRVVDVNVTGVFLGMRAVLPIMKAQGRGSIVNLSSLAGKKGMVNLAGYCASKAAVISLTQTAALEAAPEIRVNAVCPGVVNTEMQQREYQIISGLTGEDPKAIEQNWLKDMPLGEFQEPGDIADAVCFLSSRRARQITGEAINVNGGLLMD
ncbi:SDR family NAD(P)-dependent oxidoreductase [Nocardia sp. BMG51109]|uniref:SDR family NAD(P)-dependent oxidoreductase n=1 Tax=Nocardia sp. BMG51109 TaxID=1056816 RepID=UPI00046677C2|nr:SDR family NAD(P)-dependent oxidoreductase [Nocardia sp. BMG51109]